MARSTQGTSWGTQERLAPPMNYLVKARARLDLKSHWRYIARDNLPAADFATVLFQAESMMLASTSEITPPCGVPIRGWITLPSSSSMPARSHLWIRFSKAPSAILCSSIRSNHSHRMLSKNPLMSASTTSRLSCLSRMRVPLAAHAYPGIRFSTVVRPGSALGPPVLLPPSNPRSWAVG